jgi:hypothetical protein
MSDCVNTPYRNSHSGSCHVAAFAISRAAVKDEKNGAVSWTKSFEKN